MLFFELLTVRAQMCCLYEKLYCAGGWLEFERNPGGVFGPGGEEEVVLLLLIQCKNGVCMQCPLFTVAYL